MTRAPYLCKQFFEIPVPMLISLSFKMKMVVTKLMLDDADQFIHSELLEILRIHIDMMGLQHIAAACRTQARVEVGLMTERPFKQTFG